MPTYLIKREHLTIGARIAAMANPNHGKVFELVHIQPAGYDRRNGSDNHFIGYDFREVESGHIRQGFTLNYINRYFVILDTPTAP